MKKSMMMILLMGLAAGAMAKVPLPPLRPRPPEPPVFRPKALRTDEQAVKVETRREIVADNGLCRRVSTTLTFTNPNPRVFEGELEFPLPEGATVCGYALEVNGELVPGVVCEKEKARVAFENEKRQGVDPGIVENVKGNVWRTRIYPLMPNQPRKARVEYVEPNERPTAKVVAERDGNDVFIGEAAAADGQRTSVADRLRAAKSGWIVWDASFSRQGKVAADRNLLELLPARGEWKLVVFRDVPEAVKTFTSRQELLQAVDAVVYDGGTCFESMSKALGEGDKFLFSDEVDTLSIQAPDFERDPSVVFASRPDAKARKVNVRKLATDEKAPCEVREGRLLATMWAAAHIADLASQADQRKAEFLELGRKYGIAGPNTSLIVLERLDQYLTYKIEPPKSMSFHDEWVRRRKADDDAIDAESARADHRRRLLDLWSERVKWWNDPVPRKATPSSGLFGAARMSAELAADDDAVPRAVGAAAPVAAAAAARAAFDDEAVSVRSRRNAPRPPRPVREGRKMESRGMARGALRAQSKMMPEPPERGPDATVKIAAWDPKMPYLNALKRAEKGSAYAEYLKQRELFGKSPAFFLDCAGWFFKAGELGLGCRIISNLAEMKLEDVGLWRTMGWRLREAGAYNAAAGAFRHVLAMRGEESQSKRDLALVLVENAKLRLETGAEIAAELAEAAKLLASAAFDVAARRSARRSNDMQTSVLALEELNGLLTWAESKGCKFAAPSLESAFRRDLPMDLRIVVSWDTDETDIDIHVLEPGGEEAFYRHRRTSTGGFVSEDVTTGYGPEEYLKKQAEKGVYRVLANYYASHRQQLSGAAVVTATVYTGWGMKDEKRQVLSFRLDKAKDKHPIGEIEIK